MKQSTIVFVCEHGAATPGQAEGGALDAPAVGDGYESARDKIRADVRRLVDDLQRK